MANKKTSPAPRAASPRRPKGGAQSIKKQLHKAERVERPEPLPLRQKVAAPADYPMSALGALAEGASAIADVVQCPLAMAGTSVLAAAALASQALADIVHPATGRKRPISLFFASVAKTGERKSEVDAFALEPIRRRERELRRKFEDAVTSYQHDREVYERQKEYIAKTTKGNPSEAMRQLRKLGPPPLPPLEPVLTTDDATLEGIHKQLSRGEPSLGLFSDEGGMFVNGYSMLDDSRGRTGSGLSNLWDGKDLKRSRSLEGSMVLIGRRVSMHLMIQPIFKDKLLGDYVLQGQGLTSRILPSAPSSLVGTRMYRPIKKQEEAALERYTKRVLKMLHEPQIRDGKNGGELAPRAITLSLAAKKKWSEFYNECERETLRGGRFESISGFANKLAEQALRTSAILQLAENLAAKEVSADVFDRAVMLMRYHASEALRLFEGQAVPAEIQRAEVLLDWLHEKGKTTVWTGDICQNGPNSIRQVRLIREALAILTEHHWAFKIEGGAKIDGKHHREAWEIVMP